MAERASARSPDSASPHTPDNDRKQAEASRLYAEAHEHFLAGRCNEAMPLLVRLSSLVSSPNPRLLLARCLADAGRRVEAAARYADVERDALAAVRRGESYADTAAAAATEGAEIRAKLGTLRVRLVAQPCASPSTSAQAASCGGEPVRIEIDGGRVEPPPGGDVSVLHEPGSASVVFLDGARRREQEVRILAGKESLVMYERDDPAAAPKGLPRAAFATAGVAVVGLGTFVTFGLLSESTYADLSRQCAPQCGAADQHAADKGRAFQTVANVGLAVGLIGAAATALLVLLR